MDRNLLRLILLFVFTFGLLAFYSFLPKPVSFWGIEIKQSGIRQALNQAGETEEVIPFDSLRKDSLQKDSVPVPAKPQMDSTSQKILLIGDSMLEGLMLRMQDYVEHNGHTLQVVIWYSATSKWYGSTDTLTHFLKKYGPDYVMLVLGANELFIRDIIKRRDKYVKHILRQIGDRKFIWIGPPNWKDDTGINELILKNVGKGRYFPSKDLTFKRYSDGAHPTRTSAAKWMDSVATWIMRESRYPILLEEPDKKRSRRPHLEILQPLH